MTKGSSSYVKEKGLSSEEAFLGKKNPPHKKF